MTDELTNEAIPTAVDANPFDGRPTSSEQDQSVAKSASRDDLVKLNGMLAEISALVARINERFS